MHPSKKIVQMFVIKPPEKLQFIKNTANMDNLNKQVNGATKKN